MGEAYLYGVQPIIIKHGMTLTSAPASRKKVQRAEAEQRFFEYWLEINNFLFRGNKRLQQFLACK